MVLHIHSGDCSADEARKASISGRHLPWREALIAGPIPRPHEDWVKVRGVHLREAYGASIEDYQREISLLREALGALHPDEEVVLWFDADLFCQVNLYYLLHQLRECRHVSLTPSHHRADPGEAFARRRRLTAEEISAGGRAWQCYSSDDPHRIEAEIRNGSPFAAALLSHLERYPSTENGLGAIERTILELVGQGQTRFHALFHAFWAVAPQFGYGDAQLWNEMVRLADAERPLLRIEGVPPDASISLTEDSAQVLEGQGDFVAWNGIDLWLGGVHLAGREARWRWNGERLVGG